MRTGSLTALDIEVQSKCAFSTFRDGVVCTPGSSVFLILHTVLFARLAVEVRQIECALSSRILKLPLIVHFTERHAGKAGTHSNLLTVKRERIEFAFLANRPNNIGRRIDDLAILRRYGNRVIVVAAVGVAQRNILSRADDNNLVAFLQFGSENILIAGCGFGAGAGIGSCAALDIELKP